MCKSAELSGRLQADVQQSCASVMCALIACTPACRSSNSSNAAAAAAETAAATSLRVPDRPSAAAWPQQRLTHHSCNTPHTLAAETPLLPVTTYNPLHYSAAARCYKQASSAALRNAIKFQYSAFKYTPPQQSAALVYCDSYSCDVLHLSRVQRKNLRTPHGTPPAGAVTTIYLAHAFTPHSVTWLWVQAAAIVSRVAVCYGDVRDARESRELLQVAAVTCDV